MGRVTRRQRTPGMVSTSGSGCCWASWNALMLAKATSNAALTSGSSSGAGRSCVRRDGEGEKRAGEPSRDWRDREGLRTSTLTQTGLTVTPSNFCVYSETAASPRLRTSSTIGFTCEWREMHQAFLSPGADPRELRWYMCVRTVSRMLEKSTRGLSISLRVSAYVISDSVYVLSSSMVSPALFFTVAVACTTRRPLPRHAGCAAER